MIDFYYHIYSVGVCVCGVGVRLRIVLKLNKLVNSTIDAMWLGE